MDPVRFDNFTLRPVTEDDYPALDAWIMADPAHASYFEPDFFLGREISASGEMAPDPRATCYALEDEKGVVFYIRLQRAARVYIQFPPTERIGDRGRRVAHGLIQGMAFLEAGLSRAGCAEWIFATESNRLAKLAKRALGFAESRGEMVRPMTRLDDSMELLYGLQPKGKEGA